MQARLHERQQMNDLVFSALVVDISHVQGAVYAPSNGRIPMKAGERAPPTGDHRYATAVRELQGA